MTDVVGGAPAALSAEDVEDSTVSGGRVVRRGPRAGRSLRSETLRARVTFATRREVIAEADREVRSESDMVRILIAEALAERRRRALR